MNDGVRQADLSDVVDVVQVPPDPGLVNSLGKNHTFESAIADLVDNSIDAGASRIVIQLLTQSGRLVEVRVLDDGHGMDHASIEAAMRLGHQRDYSADELGHFGLGLKAASLSFSSVLTVWSKHRGHAAVGRRIRSADFSKDYSCEVLAEAASERIARRRQAALGTDIGTTVIWSDLTNVYSGTNEDDARSWLAQRENALRLRLGVVFHRIIEAHQTSIDVMVDEVDSVEGAIGIPVGSVDPFSYARSGHPGYPKELTTTLNSQSITLRCHIWPPRSDRSGFRLEGKAGAEHQGFFVYRNGRLLQTGGWSETTPAKPNRGLARVEIDDSAIFDGFVSMNPEKNALRFEPEFRQAIDNAVAPDGTTFADFLSDAETLFKESNKRQRKRQPAIEPGKGIAPAVKKAISKELPMMDIEPLSIKWRTMKYGNFLEVDLPESTLWLNSRYRHLVAPQGGSLNDAPIAKALLYLLTHKVFEGQKLGARDKDEIAIWSSVLAAAADAELAMQSEDK